MFHSGEQSIQSRIGVRDTADKIGRSIRREMPPVAQEFLQDQNLVIIGSKDKTQRMWATAFAGDTGFAMAKNPRTILIRATAPLTDPVYQNAKEETLIGMIATDFMTHRRMRANGTGCMTQDGLEIICAEVYSNCGRYIQTRKPHFCTVHSKPNNPSITKSLTHSQETWIENADTFFIATSHPVAGADVSHKGGSPGFVHATSETELQFLDYAGNSLFNSLGNIIVNPYVGLLFLDFTSGHTLQISGKAQVLFSETNERTVKVAIEEIVETLNAVPLSYDFIAYAPTNPK